MSYWLESSTLHEYYMTCMWQLEKEWPEYITEKYNLKNSRCLSIGCGEGAIERMLTKLGSVKDVDAFDINEESIEKAKALAEKEGYDNIKYFVADANDILLPQNKYDIVIANSSIHHVHNLDHIMKEVSESLTPFGIFVLVEFVGPTRFKWTDEQLGLINGLIDVLPERFKKPHIDHKTFEGYLRDVPDEAIRSSDILQVLNNYFDEFEVFDMGGTLLHLLFMDVVENIDSLNVDDVALVKTLCFFEKTLIEKDVLPSDFKLLITRSKYT